MVVSIVRLLLALTLGFSVIAAFASIAAVFVGLVGAAKRRKPNIRLIQAIASRNVMFRPELYEEGAQRWAKLHRWGFATAFIALVIVLITSFLLDAFGRT